MKKYIAIAFPNATYEIPVGPLAVRRHTEYSVDATRQGIHVDHDAIGERVLAEFSDDNTLIAYVKTLAFDDLVGPRLVAWKPGNLDLREGTWSASYDEPAQFQVSEVDRLSEQAPMALHYSLNWQEQVDLMCLRAQGLDGRKGRGVIFIVDTDAAIQAYCDACVELAEKIAETAAAMTRARPKYPH